MGAWLDLAENRDMWWGLVNAVMNLQFPQNMGNLLTSWRPVSFSRRTVLHGDGLSDLLRKVRTCLSDDTARHPIRAGSSHEWLHIIIYRLLRRCIPQNMDPIPVLTHRLTDKFFAHCPLHPKPLVQIGNYTLADLINLYIKYKHKRTKHKVKVKQSRYRPGIARRVPGG